MKTQITSIPFTGTQDDLNRALSGLGAFSARIRKLAKYARLNNGWDATRITVAGGVVVFSKLR